MQGEFIAVLFLARDLAHRFHLRVTGGGSYAKHKALEDFYDSLVDLADDLAEMIQGRSGIIKNIPLLENEFSGDVVPSVEKQLKWIEANRYKAVAKDDTAIQNKIDEIVGLYLSLIYKLKNLE